MPFEYIDWNPLEPITSPKMNKMAENSKYLKARKIDAQIRNMGPDLNYRSGLEFIGENLVIFGEYREISPGESVAGTIYTFFEKKIQFPQNFFHPAFLPVVILSIGHIQGIRRVTGILKNVGPFGFSVEVREHTGDGGNNFTENMKYFINYIALGVKY